MVQKKIYLDNSASTPILPEVKQKVIETMEIYGNPSSLHSEGEAAHEQLVEAKRIISEKLFCDMSEIYFTSGATMSNSLFIQGFMRANPDTKLVISATEHNDIIELADYFGCYKVPVNHDGELQYEFLDNLLSELCGNVLCSIQLANGETGVINSISKISSIISKHKNVFWHSDVTQYIPFYGLPVHSMDAISMSGQKIGCIKGTGLLYVKNSVPIKPVIFGEQGFIGGTENVHGIAALGEAFKCLDYSKRMTCELRDYMISKVKGDLVGGTERRLPNNVYMHFDWIDGESLVVLLNEFGICASSGSACSSGNAKGSHVVKAMGYSDEYSKHCVRFTLSNNTTREDVDYVADVIEKISRGF